MVVTDPSHLPKPREGPIAHPNKKNHVLVVFNKNNSPSHPKRKHINTSSKQKPWTGVAAVFPHTPQTTL
jgi:hypothetical protein